MKLLFLLLFLSLNGNPLSYYRIPYRTLSWDDFRGIVPRDKPEIAAWTTCEMVMDYIEDGGRYRYVVRDYFLPDSSFVRVRTDAVLRHEQTHFKIAHLMALKCMRDMAPLQGGDSSTLKAVEAVFNHYGDERNELNARLDRYTNRSMDRDAEQNWEYNISVELAKLEASIKANNARSR